MTDPKVYLKSFSVTGRGEFPLDMLRYDRCFPINGDSAAAIHAHCRGELRTIKLEAASINKHWSPTVGRWASFGWTAVLR